MNRILTRLLPLLKPYFQGTTKRSGAPLRGIVERLSEAADRGLWAEPDPEIVAAMQRVYLELEGDLEDR